VATGLPHLTSAWESADDDATNIAGGSEWWEQPASDAMGNVYVNFLSGDEGDGRTREA
jgi:hypothetical protein